MMIRTIPFILVATAALITNATWGQQLVPATQQIQNQSVDRHGHAHSAAQGHAEAAHGHAAAAQTHAPGTQGHASGVRTEFRTVQREVQFFNPLTGRYETRIVEEVVTVQVGGPTPGGQGGHGTFLATIVNNRNELLTVRVDDQQRKLNPGQSWQVRVTDGQIFSYHGEPRMTGLGQMVGGALASARFSANQTTYNIGGGGAGPAPNPGGRFAATFVNNSNELMTISTNNQQRQLNPGQSWQINATEGQSYTYHGPGRSWQNPDGSWAAVGGALAQGRISANQKVIHLGGGGGPAPNPNAAFLVTVVNGFQNGVTVQVGNDSRKLNSGQSWQVSAREGQQYSVAGDPRQVAPGQWVGGGTYAGTFTSSKRTVNLGGGNQGGGPIPEPVPGQNPNPNSNPLGGAFQVTFTNTATGPVTLTLYDTQRNVVDRRTLQVNQSFSASARFGYSYHQDGPNVNTAFGSSSASASGGISPSNPNIFLKTPQ